MENDKTNGSQKRFNTLKGWLIEHKDHEKYPSVLIECGNERKRKVFFSVSKHIYNKICSDLVVGKKYYVSFYLISRNKNGSWYTLPPL
jgi:hypothetical protein